MKPLISLDSENILVYKCGNFYSYNSVNKSLLFLAKVPNGLIMSILAKFRLFERAFRLSPRCAKIIGTEMIFAIRGYMYSLDLESREIKIELRFRKGMKSPLYLTEINGIRGFDNGVYFGEYFGNELKEEVSIYCRNFFGDWSKVYTFHKGAINHVHNIIPCNRTDRVLICTGDDDLSSTIWEFRNNFTYEKKILTGSQLYRTCYIKPLENGFMYFTDSPNTSNHTVLVEEDNGRVSCRIINDLYGSVIYSSALPDNKTFISTTVEPSSELKGWRYMLSRKPGKGILGNEVIGYIVSPAGELEEIIRATKDRYPLALFKFGTFQSTLLNNRLYIFPESVKEIDGEMIEYSLE